MSLDHVNPPELATPRGFSHAVVGSGRTVFLAGQTALNVHGRIVGSDIVAQFDQAMANLLTALAAAGGTPDQLADLTIYLTDVEAYKANSAAIGEVWRRRVGRHYPAMAAIGVSRLWDVDAVVEIQGTAVL